MSALATGWLALAAGARRAGADAPGDDLHRSTRNTRWGAIGLRRPRLGGPPLPWKPYAGRARRPLPPPDAAPGLALDAAVAMGPAAAAGFGGKPFALEDLSRLLHYTNGLTPAPGVSRRAGRMRAAPSAGALYAGELYLLAFRIPGLAAGAYYYDVTQHALVALGATSDGSGFERAAAALEVPVLIDGAAALLLLGNVFERYTWRYGNRGYRYALIDTGHIGENLLLAAHSAGLRALALPRHQDDALASLLGIDGVQEAVCAAWAIGRSGPAASPATSARRLVQRAETADGVDGVGLRGIERLHEATKLVPAEAPGPAWAPASRSGGWQAEPAGGPAAGRVALPARSAPPAMAVEAAIEGRRSASVFHVQPLAAPDLEFALELATRPWRGGRGPGLDLLIAAHRVRDLDPGLYRWHAAGRELELLRRGSLAESLVRVCLRQEMAGAAAVACLMVARLGPDRARARDRSYRDVLIAAGALGQRLYLAAEALGLVARNLAAFIDDDLDQLLGLAVDREAVVHLTLLGPGR